MSDQTRVSLYAEDFMYVHEQSANILGKCTPINQSKNGRIITRKTDEKSLWKRTKSHCENGRIIASKNGWIITVKTDEYSHLKTRKKRTYILFKKIRKNGRLYFYTHIFSNKFWEFKYIEKRPNLKFYSILNFSVY